MLQGGFTSVLQVRDPDELLTEIVGFTRRLGFETVSATTVIDHFQADSEFITLDNTPSAYRHSFEDPGDWRRDPVMQHCKRHSVPIIWNQRTYTAVGLGEKWEGQARYGYHTGIALALHLPEGRHFFFGVDRDRPLPEGSAELTRIVADLQLFAVHAQDAAQRVLLPSSPALALPSLTPRELESLRWTMEGKTAWELGNILGISERTAVLHVNNATHKLGCVNKHQAVLKALRAGLIR
ncbi:helix-turn-helix transcriptional regulator [Piscinibacter sp.]|jgi:DNA-binding CsgD family transcriptional regulator|uniref:helix-turn-helix transcriptional regulator n=1 Tax=Piscinibacter sp. TaxID=1903157 RepID=UPI002F41132A